MWQEGFKLIRSYDTAATWSLFIISIIQRLEEEEEQELSKTGFMAQIIDDLVV